MRVLELLCEVARCQPHHTVTAEVDGAECEIVELTPAGGGDVSLVVELDESLAVLPVDADDDMLAAAFDKLSVPNKLAREVWRVMREAYAPAD